MRSSNYSPAGERGLFRRDRRIFDQRGTFTFTIPDSNNSGETAIKVICEQWSQAYTTGDYYGCSATFTRVYES